MKNKQINNRIICKFFLGNYNYKEIPQSAIKRQVKYLQDEWNNTEVKDFGLERIVRLFLFIQPFVFPGLYIRDYFGKYGVIFRKISLDVYVILKLLLPLIVLSFDWYKYYWLMPICIYFSVETLLYLLSLVFLSKTYSTPISYKRSLITLFLNYLEVSFSFAVIYAKMGIIANGVVLDNIHAIYFSIITATTIGYGDICPKTKEEMLVVIIHSIVSLVFVGVFFSYFLSHINDSSYLGKNKKDGRKTKDN